MSGGMDIDWNLRDKILANANKRFENWSKEQIVERAEALYVQMMILVQEEDNLSQAKRSIFDEQAEISAILKEKRYL